ncbi:unnamed protein product [Brassica napus]|uniref:(rape) hypothetical protein n=1 Tax=Brassica napus TaxID=3708 RepID=A0A816P8F6_BRANA|nr:unnamed protein product [Brassica napus]
MNKRVKSGEGKKSSWHLPVLAMTADVIEATHDECLKCGMNGLSPSLYSRHDFKCFVQTTSKRLADRKIEKFDKNITKRGFVPETTTKKGKDYPVGPILLGFFVFVVIGSSLFQIIRTATSGGMA